MDIEQIIGYVVNRCGFSLRQTFLDYMTSIGHKLTPEEGLILNQLWKRDQQTQTELLKVIYKGPSTLSRQLDSLEKKGLIQRLPSPQDKRKFFICLTVLGKKMEQELITYGEKMFNSISQGIDQEELDTTIQVINKLRENAIRFSGELKK